MLEGHNAAQETEPGQWQGLFFQSRLKPSGAERFTLRFSTQNRYGTPQEAKQIIDDAVAAMNAARE